MLYLYLFIVVKVISNDLDCDYILIQSDFNGTYRITNSGKYCLSEDIEFDPNPISNFANSPNSPYQASFPNDDTLYPGSQSLSNGPFSIGFFAAITIEIDNGMSLSHATIGLDNGDILNDNQDDDDMYGRGDVNDRTSRGQ